MNAIRNQSPTTLIPIPQSVKIPLILTLTLPFASIKIIKSLLSTSSNLFQIQLSLINRCVHRCPFLGQLAIK